MAGPAVLEKPPSKGYENLPEARGILWTASVNRKGRNVLDVDGPQTEGENQRVHRPPEESHLTR